MYEYKSVFISVPGLARAVFAREYCSGIVELRTPDQKDQRKSIGNKAARRLLLKLTFRSLRSFIS
jgi:hypothetical protein